MIDPPASDVDGEVGDARQHAMVGLYALTPRFGEADPGLIPGFRSASPGEALTILAEAPTDEVTVSARLDLLHELAKADFPHLEGNEDRYQQLAASIAVPNDLQADQLLGDLKAAARGDTPFTATVSGQKLDHHLTAFLGAEVCNTEVVEVDGLTATWIFSEFETDATFETVAAWVDPRNWPKRGPMMFKQMALVGGKAPVAIQPALGDDHWHGVFHEEVQLVKRVNTLLHCDYWSDAAGPGRSAGMTYQLDISLDGEIDVDRGFLLVNDVGPVRRVKALKIVGFTTDVWDQVARWVCPFWTDFVRGAVEGGSSSTPQPPSNVPTGGGAPVGGDTFDAWVRFFGESARAYLELWDDVRGRALGEGYGAAEWVEDGTKYWSQLATDWAKAWKYGLEVLDDVADQGLDAEFMPPGSAGAGTGFATMVRGAAPGAAAGAGQPTLEGTTIPVPGLQPGARLSCTDLEAIEAGTVKIPRSRVTVTVEPLGGNAFGARVTTGDAAAPPGLYVGTLLDESGRRLVPIQLYVSRATAGGS